MIWKWMDLVTEYLNPDALIKYKENIAAMSPWLQGIVIGAVFLLAGCALLELLFALQMGKYARSVVGFSVGFAVCWLILSGYTEIEELRIVLYSLGAGVAAGLLNAFLERVFQFAVGFLYGTALATWLVPQILHMDLDVNPGRILRLVIAIAAGALFALLCRKLRPVLAALLGGTILGLLIEIFLPYASIPFLPQVLKLSEGMYRNLLPLVLAAIGILIQLPQWIREIREQKERKLLEERTAEETRESSGEETDSPEEETQQETVPTPAAVSVAEAEAILVEKARELALAASRNAEDVRIRDRYEDVAEGLYGADIAAARLGMTVEAFLEGMRESGYAIPGEEEPVAEGAEDMKQEANPQNDNEPPAEDAGESDDNEPPAEDAGESDDNEPPAEDAGESDDNEPPAEDAEEKEPEAEPEEGDTDGTVREESSDLPEEGQEDLGADQGRSE